MRKTTPRSTLFLAMLLTGVATWISSCSTESDPEAPPAQQQADKDLILTYFTIPG
ncbi:MAG: hypothetical protein H6832_04880 [Planctomycetes bacterium]|nr:hypothetical protein [Planctomycetota bacterium]MCB9890475.1 hypothetical protein [Planctomycetota bacterium]MCB9917716.1 hypothetical protein [Planctomycetota bacterium]